MFWKKKRSLADFKEEVASHLAIEADLIRESGLSTDPEAAARRVFGNVTSTQEAWYEQGRWLLFDHLMRDLRQALRQMKHRPGFSLVVILTLALGIGATSGIFSIVRAVLLRPLPYQDPDRLGMLFSGDPQRDLHEGRVSLPNFRDWKSQNHSFADMTMFTGQTFLLGTNGSPERKRSARVPANFWTVLGVEPMLGRVFTTEEVKHGERVAVLSHRLWLQQFAGSKEVLGATLVMDDRNYSVIGVMPATFRFPFADTDVWEPPTAHPYWIREARSPRSDAGWLVLGRMKRDVTWTAAQTEMDAIARRIHAAYPGMQMPATAEVVPLSIQSTGRFRLSLWLLFGAVFLMLVIACINVASLLLARGAARAREFALRRALGAKSLRLAGQVLTETMVLATWGGALGLLLASGAAHALKTFGPADIPRLSEAQIDWQVILFSAGVTVFSAVFASVWPVLESNRTQVGSRQWNTVSTNRTRDFLVAAEFALALVIMSAAGLLIHSFLRLRTVELGFRPYHMLTMRVDLHVGRTADQIAAFFEEAIRRVESLPGVRSAAAIEGFLRTDPEDAVEIEGRQPQQPGPCLDAIAGRYFETAGIPLLRGRVFSNQDGRNSLPVAIINETMARAYWPGADPIGRRFRFRASSPWLTVVGVTGDMRRQGIERKIAPQVFLPHRQDTDDMMEIIVRTSVEPWTLASAIQNRIQSIDKTVARFRIATVEDELGEQTSERRFDMFLVSSFAFAALLLSAVGVYGLLHHLVVQRTNEIGVRMALGAHPGNVMILVLRRGLVLALAGTAFGLLGSLSVSRLLSSLLFEVTPTDPLTLAGSALLLLAVAGIGCLIPSRRAARIDPMLALRQD